MPASGHGSTAEIELPMKIRALSGASIEFAANAILALSGVALTYFLFYLRPVGYVYFITEDYWVEYATFVSLAMACCFLTWTLFTQKEVRKPGAFLLVLGTFLAALEEISWGQRILGFRSPGFFAERNFQGETTLHNLIKFKIGYYLVGAIVVFLWAVLLPLVTRKSIRLRRWCSHLGIPIVPMHVWPYFLLAIYFFVYPTFKKGQIAEAYLGIGLAVLSLDLAPTTRQGPQTRGAPAMLAPIGVVLSVGILTVFLVRFCPWPEELKVVLNYYAAFEYPAAGMHRQGQLVFDYMNRNPQFLRADTNLVHGVLLMRLGHRAKATEVLELVLVEQERLQQGRKDDPVPYRIAGKAHRELAQFREAERAFNDAVEKDLRRLERASDSATKAWARFSLGETFLEMGNAEAARVQLRMAREIASDPITLREMDNNLKWWFRKNAVAEKTRLTVGSR